ncbi:IS4 family transposase [Ruminococcus sp.]|uniref:IS4 family transposase n=1 Tax=Ruminococcus sp. TaxID=41978 RepID=UPI001B04CB20|nr:IS4 family transposase [Ruminococcus sp.]MBO5559078.1 IS4 family transposase [Ruminococcus sp.]
MSYAGKLRNTLSEIIDEICYERSCLSADKFFSRRGKFKPQDIFKSLLLMEDRSLSHELLPYFNFKVGTPTPSAFVQARAKILPEGFAELFKRFVSANTDDNKKYLYKGYRLFAVDGSDSHVPNNPDDPDSYFPNPIGRQYNLFHINAMYDLLRHTYTDVIIQKKRNCNERTAFAEMVNVHKNDNIPIIFTADRGYECYNDMAHIIESGHKFLIRVQDIDKRGISSGLDLPDKWFDTCVTLRLTRRYTQEVIKMRASDNRIKHIMTRFDYLPVDYDRNEPPQFYELTFRIVRFKVKDTYEVIMTNLPKEEFSKGEIKKLYGMRWGIENSFRDLKHTIGLNYYHAKKPDSILQEIYSRMVMYNFCQLVTNHVKLKPQKRGRKYIYRINFSQAIQICRNFLKKLVAQAEVSALIASYVLPIRNGRINPRIKGARRDIYFNYRIA